MQINVIHNALFQDADESMMLPTRILFEGQLCRDNSF